MTKLVFGVGFNDGIHSTILGDCKNKAAEYKFWTQMLRRCLDDAMIKSIKLYTKHILTAKYLTLLKIILIFMIGVRVK